MEDILELILSILFGSTFDNLIIKISKMPNKILRVLLMVLFLLISFALWFGLYCLCRYIFKGSWI